MYACGGLLQLATVRGKVCECHLWPLYGIPESLPMWLRYSQMGQVWFSGGQGQFQGRQ